MQRKNSVRLGNGRLKVWGFSSRAEDLGERLCSSVCSTTLYRRANCQVFDKKTNALAARGPGPARRLLGWELPLQCPYLTTCLCRRLKRDPLGDRDATTPSIYSKVPRLLRLAVCICGLFEEAGTMGSSFCRVYRFFPSYLARDSLPGLGY